MRHQIADIKLLQRERKSIMNYYLTGGFMYLGGVVIMLYIFLYFNAPATIFHKYSYLVALLIIVLAIVGMVLLILGFLISVIYAFKKSNNAENIIEKHIYFTPTEIVLEYFDGHKKEIPYDELLSGRLTIKVGFTNVLKEANYKTMDEFFDKAYEYIQNVIKKSKKPKVYPVIHIIKGSDEDFMEFVIDPEIADIKSLLEDWRKNMTEYYKTRYSPVVEEDKRTLK